MLPLYYTILNYNKCHTILYYTILYYTILYYTILYFTILYYTIIYYTTLHYTILYTRYYPEDLLHEADVAPLAVQREASLVAGIKT